MIQGMRAWCAWTGSKDDNVGNGGLQEGPGIVFSKPWFGTLNLCHVLFAIKIGSELTRMCVSQMPPTAAVTGGAASGGGGRGRGEVSPRPLSRVAVAGHVRFPAKTLSGAAAFPRASLSVSQACIAVARAGQDGEHHPQDVEKGPHGPGCCPGTPGPSRRTKLQR